MPNNEPSRSSPRIGLALSGGGFRATLFHLGAVAALRDIHVTLPVDSDQSSCSSLLSCTSSIASVSGGSILAAHLGLRWNHYSSLSDEEFSTAATQIIKAVQYDIRGRIVRRLPICVLTLLLSTVLSWITAFIPRLQRHAKRIHWSRTDLLRFYYDMLLFGNHTNNDLCSHPRLLLTATCLSKASLWHFGDRNITVAARVQSHSEQQHVSAYADCKIRLSTVVAASSAMPAFFPPIHLTGKDLGWNDPKDKLDTFDADGELLSDGGVFDNLGIRSLVSDLSQEEAYDVLIRSDATGTLTRSWMERSSGLISTPIRATDVVMSRVHDLERERFKCKYSASCIEISIGDHVKKQSGPHLSTSEQGNVKYIRTDLDRFSDTEARALILHGYNVTVDKIVREGALKGHAVKHNAMNPLRLFQFPNVAASEDLSTCLLRGERRKYRLVSIGDWATWVTLGCIVALAFLLSNAWTLHSRIGWMPTTFAIAEELVEVDLSQWKSPEKRSASKAIPVDTTTHCSKLRRLTESSQPITHMVGTDTLEAQDPNFKILSKHSGFIQQLKDGLTGSNSTSWVIGIDVSDEPVNNEFLLKWSLSSYDSFPNSEKEWTAVLISYPTSKLTISIKFPEDPFADSIAVSRFTPGNSRDPLPFDGGELVVIEGNRDAVRKLNFVVSNPDVGYYYRIDWRWRFNATRDESGK